MSEETPVDPKEIKRQQDKAKRMLKHMVWRLNPGQVFNPFTKWPRNYSCFCGSGLKFKKCCQDKIGHTVDADKFALLKTDFDKALAHVADLHNRGLAYFNPKTADFMKAE